MYRVRLFYHSEGASALERDLASLGIEVTARALADFEEPISDGEVDAIVAEAPATADDVRRLVESPARPSRAPLVLVLRPDQMALIDSSWALDDFLLLPVAAEELSLRLRRAIWRRRGIDADSTVRAGGLVVDLANYKVFIGDRPVTLTFKEFELLRFLMTNRGKVFTREALLNRVWGYEYYGGARTVDVHIRRLRSKIEVAGSVYIETVRNVGYRFPLEV